MPSRSSTGDSTLRTAHPHDIGVQEFASYALVLDARSQAEYNEDHLPGAVSVPLGPVGSRSRLGRRSVSPPKGRPDRSGAGAPSVLLRSVTSLRSGDAVLLYGAGADTALSEAASSLRARGLVVDVLAGGWPNYRRWVEAGLEVLPRRFAFRLLVPPPASDVERIADALCELGEQIVDIGACTRTDISSGTTPARGQALSQPSFETCLLNTLRHRETDRVLWVIGAHELPTTLRLPAAMSEALASAPELRLDTLQSDAIRSQLEHLLKPLRGDDGHSNP
jgi:tRNA 2-selenouridine synthase